ncbi:hypothetical protein ACVGWU_00125, partial [Enterobacter intestinihominis]
HSAACCARWGVTRYGPTINGKYGYGPPAPQIKKTGQRALFLFMSFWQIINKLFFLKPYKKFINKK